MKKFTTLFLVMLLIFCSVPTSAFALTSGKFEYEVLEDGTAEITKYSGTARTVTIPNEIDGYKVSAIGNSAFRSTDVINVFLPGSITSIGNYAFYSTELEYIDFSIGLKSVGNYAFQFCNFKTVTLPNTVKNIGFGAFSYCTSLTSAILPETVVDLKDSVFEGCTKLESVSLPTNIDIIGWSMFVNCKSLKSITVPSGVTEIGNWAFDGCSALTSISLPESLTTIGEVAFRKCTSLKTIDIPSSVTTIETCAFLGCSSLNSIKIPEGVTAINLSTFKDCTSLYSVSLPSGLETVGESAFKNCSILNYVSLGRNVKTIEATAFYNCSGLSSVYIYGNLTSIGSGAFTYCNKLKYVVNYSNLYFVKGSTDYGNIAYYIGNSEDDYLFNYAQGSCGSGVNYRFDWNTNILTISGYGDMVRAPYGDDPWNYYSSLIKKIVINEGITGICDDAFDSMSQLSEVSLPNSLKSIGKNAFRDCPNLVTLNIPDSVTKIGEKAFLNTGYYNTEDNWQNDVLYIDNHLITVKDDVSGAYEVKAGTKTIADFAFKYCDISEIIIANSVVSIGKESLASVYLYRVTIPNSVEFIAIDAFDKHNLPKLSVEDNSYAYQYAIDNEIRYSIYKGDTVSNITIDFPKEFYDDETEMIVKDVDKTSVEIPKEYDFKNAIVYDISLEKSGSEIQPGTDVTVRIPVPTNIKGEKCIVLHVKDDGTVENMNASFINGYMVFTTDHFSHYILTRFPYSAGDVNDYGGVTLADVSALAQYVAEWDMTDGIDYNSLALDVNGDGEITLSDVSHLAQYVAEWEGIELH